VADRFGFGRFGAVRGRVRAAVAACAQRRAILAAQDDPAALRTCSFVSLLRTNQAVIAENIEAALAAGDADLASSFVELARKENISLGEELSATG